MRFLQTAPRQHSARNLHVNNIVPSLRRISRWCQQVCEHISQDSIMCLSYVHGANDTSQIESMALASVASHTCRYILNLMRRRMVRFTQFMMPFVPSGLRRKWLPRVPSCCPAAAPCCTAAASTAPSTAATRRWTTRTGSTKRNGCVSPRPGAARPGARTGPDGDGAI